MAELFPGDIERTAWVSGNTDLSLLPQNAVRWMLRGETPIRQFSPIGPQQVRMVVPGRRRISRVELLRAETDVAFRQRNEVVEFVIPKVVDYEVAALHAGD